MSFTQNIVATNTFFLITDPNLATWTAAIGTLTDDGIFQSPARYWIVATNDGDPAFKAGRGYANFSIPDIVIASAVLRIVPFELGSAGSASVVVDRVLEATEGSAGRASTWNSPSQADLGSRAFSEMVLEEAFDIPLDPSGLVADAVNPLRLRTSYDSTNTAPPSGTSRWKFHQETDQSPGWSEAKRPMLIITLATVPPHYFHQVIS